MPKSLVGRLISRRSVALTLSVAVAGIAAAALPSAAAASSSQISIIEDPGATIPAASAATFSEFRALGATTARVFLPWSQIAPDNSSAKKPAHFNPSDPNAYPAGAWMPYDTAVVNAAKYGVTVDLIVAGGAPQWAEGKAPIKGYNPYFAWKPSDNQFGQFMKAVARRYSGTFVPRGSGVPLPRVHFWTIWNEPNFGENLGPQAIGGSKYSVAPKLYRGLMNAGWSALMSTGHKHDTILVGGYAARGIQGGRFPGNFGQTKPLLFIRTLYCVDKNNRALRGNTAKQEGCPTNTASRRKFRKQNPPLFNAGGVADHPYPNTGSPTNDGKGVADWATFPDLPKFGALLDKMTKTYGSGKHFPIYNDEYGYITKPPSNARASGGGFYPSPAKASEYINQAEYLSYKNARIKSYMQYLLQDPPVSVGLLAGFDSGLEFIGGAPKATYFAFNLPVWMPKTSFSKRSKVEVWGDARPASFETRQHVQIQEGPTVNGPFSTLNTVGVKKNGYFDIKMKFPSSGFVRLTFTYDNDPRLPAGISGSTIASRVFPIKVH
jgi:hypothetical protein